MVSYSSIGESPNRKMNQERKKEAAIKDNIPEDEKD
jgi:hypothetical protein